MIHMLLSKLQSKKIRKAFSGKKVDSILKTNASQEISNINLNNYENKIKTTFQYLKIKFKTDYPLIYRAVKVVIGSLYLYYRVSRARGVVNKKGNITFCEKKESVILVSHDASRTGAPILAYNIGKILSEKFNTIVILLGNGDIEPSFLEVSCEIFKITNFDKYKFNRKIKSIGKIKFCLVNTVESHLCLQSLAESHIPTVTLIHEFAGYIPHSKEKFTNTFFWSNATVFSTKMTQESAVKLMSNQTSVASLIFPQGKCEIPIENKTLIGSNSQNRNVIFESLKNNSDSKPFFILGAGSVQYRKGVDLFIAVAGLIKQMKPECNIHFIWVGSGYDPVNDSSYSSFLFEEINVFGLNDNIHIFEATSYLEDIYKSIDVFFLSSRLDPLPNVAIDAICHGIPLICFEKSSGIAEFLEQDEDTTTCVIPYMDIKGCAEKILELYFSSDYYKFLETKIKKISRSHFDMRKYVSCLIELGCKQEQTAKQEAIDCFTLENSNDFPKNFCFPNLSRKQAIRKYVRSWHAKVDTLRKPAPGFNPFLYDLNHSCRSRNVEPFADYINQGKPEGEWQEKLIQPFNFSKKALQTLKCAIHIHAFYPHLLPLILKRLHLNSAKYDLFISTSAISHDQVHNILKKNRVSNYQLNIVPNKGRDIGPLITEFGFLLQKYDVIGHIHTKESLFIKNKKIIEDWVYFLLENLIGGKFAMMDCILYNFKQNTNLGLVFPDDPNLLDWGKNKSFADKLALELELPRIPNGKFNFPVGTMFWARPEALKPLLDSGWFWDKFPSEPLPYDGSELHAIERLIPSIVACQGFSQAVTYVPGLTR